MTDLYKRLAEKLDELPNGYPATESGVELKILQKVFDPEEAETALELRVLPTTADKVAGRLGKPVEEVKALLDQMVKKGGIGSIDHSGRRVYLLIPFVIGIYENQLERMDQEFADLFAAYRPYLMKSLGGHGPAVTRVVPVNRSIKAEHQVLRFEDLRGMVEGARSFVVRECICRKQKAFEGEPCNHPSEVCLGFSPAPGAFEGSSHPGKVITKEEAYRVLALSEKAGLVPCTYNVQEGHHFVCNCCTCCCELLKGLKEQTAPYLLAGSNYAAEIDQETCMACGVCADERCMMDAIVESNSRYQVLSDRCIGCGICTTTCPTESITLKARPQDKQTTPPVNLMDWGKTRAAIRDRSRGAE
ncbi:MAG: 4Fe-4S binding protein [Planctomycetes bacterium]|nr:4Fe-4S binding protein [Planctomycetota bacterium]